MAQLFLSLLRRAPWRLLLCRCQLPAHRPAGPCDHLPRPICLAPFALPHLPALCPWLLGTAPTQFCLGPAPLYTRFPPLLARPLLPFMPIQSHAGCPRRRLLPPACPVPPSSCIALLPTHAHVRHQHSRATTRHLHPICSKTGRPSTKRTAGHARQRHKAACPSRRERKKGKVRASPYPHPTGAPWVGIRVGTCRAHKGAARSPGLGILHTWLCVALINSCSHLVARRRAACPAEAGQVRSQRCQAGLLETAERRQAARGRGRERTRCARTSRGLWRRLPMSRTPGRRWPRCAVLRKGLPTATAAPAAPTLAGRQLGASMSLAVAAAAAPAAATAPAWADAAAAVQAAATAPAAGAPAVGAVPSAAAAAAVGAVPSAAVGAPGAPDAAAAPAAASA